MPVFALPAAFFALAAIPGLVAIYWLRTRSRRVPVSSLALWIDQRRARQGGTRVERFQMPLLLILEILAILALTLAAASPLFLMDADAPTLYVVLDDSFSMRADGENSPRSRAADAVRAELGIDTRNPFAKPRYEARYIVAGRKPRLAETDGGMPDENEWSCRSPVADIAGAVALAEELSQEAALILVVSDEPPAADIQNDRLKWRSFGRAKPNAAIVNATRSPAETGERCLLEIANLSKETYRATLVIEELPDSDAADENIQPSVLREEELTLDPEETRRLIFSLPEGTPGILARIGADALNIDNEAYLLPEERKQARVQLDIQNESLRRRVRSGLESTGAVHFTNLRPELLLTDAPFDGPPASPQVWRVLFDAPDNAAAYVGPFVVDQTHPLAEGAGLDGVVWAAGEAEEYAGMPVVTAGNVPLIVDAERSDGGRDLKWSLRIDLSNLQDAPAWPIFMWNLAQWRVSETPGLRRINYRLGDDVSLTVNPPPPESVEEAASIVSPSGVVRDLPPPQEGVYALAEETGVYRIEADGEEYRFAVSAFSKNESNLLNKDRGEWGGWAGSELLERGYRDMGWALMLLAVLILTAHMILAAAEGGTARPAETAA